MAGSAAALICDTGALLDDLGRGRAGIPECPDETLRNAVAAEAGLKCLPAVYEFGDAGHRLRVDYA